MRAVARPVDDFAAVPLPDLEPGCWHAFLLRYDAQPSGSALAVPVAILRGADRGPRITIVAGVHGDEFEGVRALWHLLEEPSFRIDCGTLIVVPIAHPPAYNAGTRTSPLDGLNLARVFPGVPHGTSTERLAYTLFYQLVRDSTLLVDLHSGGVRYLHVPLAGFYDLPGHPGEQSFAAAQATGWPYLWAAPLRPGVLSYEAVRHGIPALGTELGGAGRCLSNDVATYAPALRRLLRHTGNLAPEESESPASEQRVIDGDWLVAPAAGFLDTTVDLHQQVCAGQVLGQILDQFGSPVAELRAEQDGVVVGIRAYPPVLIGEWGIFVGRVRDREAM
jgi:predicted deacylase